MARPQHAAMRRLERLARLRDFKIEKGLVDPRGWKVVDGEGQPVGGVRDLIVDTDRMTTPYIDVELDSKVFDLRDDPHILVPIERAHRDGDQRRLIVGELTRSRVGTLFEARAEHEARFWDEWWHANSERPGESVRPRATASNLEGTRQHVEPGEEIRAPVVNDELIAERRPMHPDERMVAGIPPDERRQVDESR